MTILYIRGTVLGMGRTMAYENKHSLVLQTNKGKQTNNHINGYKIKITSSTKCYMIPWKCKNEEIQACMKGRWGKTFLRKWHLIWDLESISVRSQSLKASCCMIPLYEMFKIDQSTEAHSSWWLVVRGWGMGRGGVRSDDFLSRGFPWEVMKMFWTEIEVVVNALNSSKSFPLKC